MAAVTICSDFGAQKLKSDTVCTVSPSISHEVMGPDAMRVLYLLSHLGSPRDSIKTLKTVNIKNPFKKMNVDITHDFEGVFFSPPHEMLR